MVNYPMLKTFYFNLWNEQERINPKTGVVEGVTPIQGDSIEAIKFLKSCGVVPDVVFVDGDHTYEKVLQDLDRPITIIKMKTKKIKRMSRLNEKLSIP